MLSQTHSAEQYAEQQTYKDLNEKVSEKRKRRDVAIQTAIDTYKQEVQEMKRQKHELKIHLFREAVLREIENVRSTTCRKIMFVPQEFISEKDIMKQFPSTEFFRRRVHQGKLHIKYHVNEALIAIIDHTQFPVCDTLRGYPITLPHNMLKDRVISSSDGTTRTFSGIWIAENVLMKRLPDVIRGYVKSHPKTLIPHFGDAEHCLFIPTMKTFIRWMKKGVNDLKWMIPVRKRYIGDNDVIRPKGDWVFTIDLLAISSFD